MIVYGYNVAEAIFKKEKNYNKIKKIIIQDNMQSKFVKLIPNQLKIKTFYVTKKEIDVMAKGLHQGIMIDIDYSYCPLNSFLKKNPNNIIILDHIEDPHNLGAIIRTANLAGAHGVIIPKNRAVGLTATVARTSAGAINYTPVAKVTNLGKTIEELKKQGLWFVCADMGGEVMYRLNLKGPIGLVIGNEGDGVSRLVREKCDYIASIPMHGDIDSLNASVAAGVLAYEIVRQRLS